MGNMVGRTLRIDENSLRISGQGQLQDITDRGRFVPICVEIDLSKSFLSKSRIKQRQLLIGYEGLHMICFLCGQYGHRKDKCLLNLENMKKIEEDTGGEKHCDNPDHSHVEESTKEEIEKSQEVNGFGNWMTVQRRNNKRIVQLMRNKEIYTGKEKHGLENNGNSQSNNVSESKFGLLEKETEESFPNQKTDVAEEEVNNGKNAGESSQNRRSQGGRKKKNSTDKSYLKQGYGTEVKEPRKQVLKNQLPDPSRDQTLKLSSKEVILVNRGSFGGRPHGESSLCSKPPVMKEALMEINRSEAESKNKPTPMLKEYPPDGGGGGKNICQDERVAMTLDDITNAAGIK
ncbi:uncharacterized protein LOC133313890 [Gastrolobium bilobum]|uniref:uncharacterized protein LOC133313890 n=1 Tax=Gastrolobium bilobum TaxID=150636 RepID=UPI002AAF9EB5|nr:uncharacterized protein LOC133313890 [Gastrolobium bilobum]